MQAWLPARSSPAPGANKEAGESGSVFLLSHALVCRHALMQYCARLNAEKLKSFIHKMNAGKVGKK